MNFAKKTKVVDFEYVDIDPEITLAAIAGQGKVISELRQFVDSIRYRDVFRFWKSPIKSGILLTGSPGCGKTTSVKALVNETESTFIELNYLEVASMYIDRPLETIREILHMAEEESKVNHVILFCDELDSLLPSRSGSNLQHESDKRRVNAFLTWMDGGLAKHENITVIGATNYLEGIDPAAKRPGRFDVIIEFKKMTKGEMLKVFKVHIKKRQFHEGRKIIKGFSLQKLLPHFDADLRGADIEEIVKTSLDLKAEKHKRNIISFLDKGEIPTLEEINKQISNKTLIPPPVTAEDMIQAIKSYDPELRGLDKIQGSGQFGFRQIGEAN